MAGTSLVTNKKILNGVKLKESHTKYICNSCISKYCDNGICSILGCVQNASINSVNNIPLRYVKNNNCGKICVRCSGKYRIFGKCHDCYNYAGNIHASIINKSYRGYLCIECHDNFNKYGICSSINCNNIASINKLDPLNKFKDHICAKCYDKFLYYGICSIIDCNSIASSNSNKGIVSRYIKKTDNYGKICTQCVFKYRKYDNCIIKGCTNYAENIPANTINKNYTGFICADCYDRYKTVKVDSKHGTFKLCFDYLE